MTSPLHLSALFCAVLALGSAAQAVTHPIRLFEISVVRFERDADTGESVARRGLFDTYGRLATRSVDPVPQSVVVPEMAYGRTVITLESWIAYGNLGPDAVANFTVDELTGWFAIGGRYYYFVTVAENPKFDLGDAVNLSSRGRVAPDEEPLIGGFVIENQPRMVLIRGIGPTLGELGVTTPVADPYILLQKVGSQHFQIFNDDWGQRPDADQIIQVSAQVGAFTLPTGSKDAVLLIELEPGAYTVHLSTDGPAGTGLLEIYVAP